MVGTVSMIVLSLMAYVTIRRQRIRANTMEATSNLRSMSFALFEFETAYGAYPSGSTSAAVTENTGSVLPLGSKSSNEFFRQLIASEVCQSESMFYARIPGAHKPDNFFDSTHALDKGEVGFSYIVGQTKNGNPKRPLVVTPLIPGTNRFDPKPFDGNAMVLCIDGAGTRSGPLFPINKNGEVIDASGKHILDPANPIWGGEVPVIAWPE